MQALQAKIRGAGSEIHLSPPILEGRGVSIQTSNRLPQSRTYSELPQAFGDWLNQFHWDSFWTLTFKDVYGEQAAIRAITRWANKHTISESFSMSWVFFLELHKSGAIHAHGLTRHEKRARHGMWFDWHDRHGIARGLPYNEDGNAQYYCAKYLTKAFVSYIIDDRK